MSGHSIACWRLLQPEGAHRPCASHSGPAQLQTALSGMGLDGQSGFLAAFSATTLVLKPRPSLTERPGAGGGVQRVLLNPKSDTPHAPHPPTLLPTQELLPMASRVARGLTPCPLWACQLLPARGSSVCVPDPPCPRALGPAAPSVGNTPSSYLLNDRASELMSEPYRPHRKSDRLRPPPSPPPAARAPVLGRQSQPGPAGRSPRPRSQGAAAPDPAAQTTQQRHRETSVKAAGSGRIAQQPGSARRDSRPTGPRGRRKRLSSRRTKSWAVSYSSRSLGRGGGGRCRQPSTGGLGLRRELRV